MCKICQLHPVYEFTNKRKLCSTCFLRWFQKKFLYTIRKYNMIKTKDRAYFTKGNAINTIVLDDLLKILIKNSLITITKNKRTADKIILPDDVDSTSYNLIRTIIKGNISKIDIKPNKGKEIKPLYSFLNKEIELYAKIKKLKYKHKKEQKDKIFMFIDELELKHPEIKQAIVNGYLPSILLKKLAKN